MAKNLSRRMPIAERSPLNFEDYEVEKGTALSITTSVAEMNRFYHPAKGLEGATAWQGGIGSVSYGRSLSNFDDALDFVNTFEFPQEWRVKIEKAAHRLQEAFQATLKPMITRDQFSGNFDFDKLPDLHMQLAQGTVEMDKLLPYWTYEMKPPKKPTVAIIGAGSWADMWGHPLYIPMVAALSTAVTWACQAADYHCYSAMVQGNARRVPERYKYLVNAFMFASPYDTVTLRDYAVLFHRDLYRWGWMTAHSAVMDTHKRLYELCLLYTSPSPRD